MPDEYRVTIRLSPELYAQLEARGSHGQPLAAIVRDALADYLARQPEPTGRLDVPGTTLAAMAASLAELQAHVPQLTARLEGLAAEWQPLAARVEELHRRVAHLTACLDTLAAERQPAAARQSAPAPSEAAMADTAAEMAAMRRSLDAIEQRLTAFEVAAANGSQQRPSRLPEWQPPPESPQGNRGEMRRRIVALLRAHPEGLSPAQLRDQLQTDRDLNNTCFAMARDGLLRRLERGRYVVNDPAAGV
jgi:hypothetical protein